MGLLVFPNILVSCGSSCSLILPSLPNIGPQSHALICGAWCLPAVVSGRKGHTHLVICQAPKVLAQKCGLLLPEPPVVLISGQAVLKHTGALMQPQAQDLQVCAYVLGGDFDASTQAYNGFPPLNYSPV